MTDEDKEREAEMMFLRAENEHLKASNRKLSSKINQDSQESNKKA